MGTVSWLANSLEKKLNNQASYMSISTRVLLRTGVNLRQPSADHDRDAAVVAKVRATLADMGFSF